MKRKNATEEVKSSVQEKKRKERGEGMAFNKCRWYDKSTERDFHRKVGSRNDKGERTEIVEVRAVCRNPKAKSYGHLVEAVYDKRQCQHWEKGTYKPPEKKAKRKSKSKRKERK